MTRLLRVPRPVVSAPWSGFPVDVGRGWVHMLLHHAEVSISATLPVRGVRISRALTQETTRVKMPL